MGQTLQSVLPAGRYEVAKANFAELGFNIENFHRMKPWMAATAVTALELQKFGFESAFGVDRHFYEKAKAAGKTIQALETVEFQLGLFDNLSTSIQELFLMQSLEDLKNVEARINGMVDAWTQGNVQDLERILEGMREYPELYHALVVSRNQNWLPHLSRGFRKKIIRCLSWWAPCTYWGRKAFLPPSKKRGTRWNKCNERNSRESHTEVTPCETTRPWGEPDVSPGPGYTHKDRMSGMK